MSEYQAIAGNYYDKYRSKRTIEKYLVDRFILTIDRLLKHSDLKDLIDVGCGQGEMLLRYSKKGFSAFGIDLELDAVEITNSRITQEALSASCKQHSIYELDSLARRWPVVLCLEVLEHLENPKLALSSLKTIAEDLVIISVPREPIWRMLNLARGAYLSSLGNTPGHIQHWTSGQIISLVAQDFEIIEVCKPLPWTIICARAKS